MQYTRIIVVHRQMVSGALRRRDAEDLDYRARADE